VTFSLNAIAAVADIFTTGRESQSMQIGSLFVSNNRLCW